MGSIELARALMVKGVLTDAARDEISVFIQLGGPGERAHLRRLAKTLQVEHLTSRDFVEQRANVSAVCRSETLEPSQRFWERFNKGSLGRVFLQWRKGYGKIDNDIRVTPALDRSRRLLEFFCAHIARNLSGIGHGVGCSRQQISQADRLAQPRRQEADGKIKRARDGAENGIHRISWGDVLAAIG